MKQSKGASRPKRGYMVINLIQTPAGYSIIEGVELLNKVQNQTASNNQVPQAQQSQATTNVYQPPLPIIKQQPKMTIKQNNLYFLKSSVHQAQKQSHSQRINEQNIPPSFKSYADWFNFDQVSTFQKTQIKFWVFQKNFQKVQDNDPAFITWIEKYKKHRNTMIQIYYANFAPFQSYMSASAIRKYIYDDADWLIRIHIFLTSWGIINTNKINFSNQNFQTSSIYLLQPSGKYGALNLKKHTFMPSKNNMQAQNFATLKKVTQNVRPYCDYCGIHCEMVWFQHVRVMDPKQISTIMKNVNSKNPPLSEKQYEIILCTKCFCNGNFPLLLTHHDFRKISVNDRLQPGKKKKMNKNKRKEKKRKNKQKQMLEQQQQYKQQIEQAEDEGTKKKQQEQNQNQQQKDDAAVKDRKLNGININGNKQIKNSNAVEAIAAQPEKQTNITEIIQQIVNSVKDQRVWSCQEILKLLELVQRNGDDWDLICKNLKKANYCLDCEPQDVIAYFLKMPLNKVSSLIQQNNSENFVNQNQNQYKSDFLIKKVQRNLDNFVKIHRKIDGKQITKQITEQKNWKSLINKFVQIYTYKVLMKIEKLSQIQQKTVAEQRKYEQATKQISDE